MCETLFNHLSIDKSTTNKNKPTAPQINDEQRTALTLLCDLIKIDSQNDRQSRSAFTTIFGVLWHLIRAG